MNDEIKDSLFNFFNWLYKGNQQAVMLAVTLFDISQTWDDLVDGDDVEPDAVNRCFVNCLVVLPQNPIVWQMPELPHHIYNVFLRWRDATNIENNSPSDIDLDKCYMLRAGIYDIFVLIAAKLYGDDYAKEVGPSVRKFYGETLKTFKQEFING